MAIDTPIQRENLAVAYGGTAIYASLHTADPGTTGAGEISGGSPAYARKPLAWTAGTTDGVVTATVTFDVPAGTTVAGGGVWTLASGGTYLDGGAVTSQAFVAQGTYTLTLTYTQS